MNEKLINEIFDRDSILKSYFDNAPDLLAVTLEGKFKYLSKNWQEVFDRTEEELLSLKPEDVLHPDDTQRTTEASRLLREQGVLKGFRNRYRAKNGEYITLSWSARVDPETGYIYTSARVVND